MEPEPVLSRDARTGETRAQIGIEADAAAVDAAVRAADATRDALADRPRRAALLRAAAQAVEARADALIAAADAETALGVPRLTGELARVAYQFRFFAGIAEDGAYLGVVVDPPDPAAVPPRPELRRWKVPIGTVAVFAASNFPFAFSVPGGDTASALAAGCPVVVKAHPDHPETSELAAAAIRDAAVEVGLPADVLTLVHGRQAGVDLVRHPLISAVGFTGSIPGGRALFDLAAARPSPIPFYGELGSLNPVLITERTAAARGAETAAGLVASYTLGQGQFCTKPGLVLVPEGQAGDQLVATATEAAAAAVPGALLDARMREHFLAGFAARAALPGVRTLVEAAAAPTGDVPQAVRAGLLEVDADTLDGGELLEECFGPVTVLVRYRDMAGVEAVLARLGGNLTATLHAEPDEPDAARWISRLARFAGRVIFGGWPTGVAVAPAMTHGGPYPATTTPTTSVGGTAIDRWLRPVTFQTVPPELLQPELSHPS
ncbi:aldehyde dehydrogenase family protein [Trebonia kvetii]|uniref:Aldehyde dehydrogenase family protein n=1 Tax=Trebonia kvetii TaxID=2480626 RepID=A0A6P2BQQ1_9ACTN|nr:aldehyde dehydrogenase family protein [Trebonia kvetii]TVZ01344.1 aldehyde dehydrogenase family protein [Trebonia kvetii]